MGLDYSANLAIGFEISYDELVRVFGKVIPEESHMEERFDHKTGKSLGQVKVVDRRGDVEFYLNDMQYDYEEELIEALCTEIGSRFLVAGSACTGEERYYIMPEFATKGGKDFGRFAVGGGTTYAKVLELAPELAILKNALENYGFRLEEPVVTLASHVY